MNCGLLFPKITDKKIRKSILKAILSIKHLIPSVKSMYENLKLLGEGARLLKELLTRKNVGPSLQEALRECWTYNRTVYIEVGNREYRKVTNLPKDKA